MKSSRLLSVLKDIRQEVARSVLLDEEARKEIGELTSAEYLDRALGDIVKRRLAKDQGRAQAFKHDESPESGGELADFIAAFQRIDVNDRTVLLHYIIKLLGESIVELLAENNRRLLRLLSK